MYKNFVFGIPFLVKTALQVLMAVFVLVGCKERVEKHLVKATRAVQPRLTNEHGVSLVVLGTLQDAGSPHIACKKACCADLFENPDPSRKVVSLGILDHENRQTYLFEATPDISIQTKLLKNFCAWEADELPSGIFLTHAHIGHYSGLLFLGKEATNAHAVPTYVMPKMKGFLEQNGPWNQLVSENNIELRSIENQKEVSLSSNLQVVPLQVPHRDEFSETVGYRIQGPNKSALFIPDIDKWEKWNSDISEVIKTVDYAFLDASFFDGNELNTRDISSIPHPFVIESMALFKSLPIEEKAKIYFIHFNHTNALLDLESEQAKTVLAQGYNIANFGDQFDL